MLAILLVLSAQYSFAQQLTTNRQVLAVAQGCGDQVYNLTDVVEMDELARCYQVAVKEVSRRQATPLQLAFLTCNEFKTNDLRRLACLRKFQESINDSDIDTLLTKCPKEDAALVKCATDKNANCIPTAKKAMQCYENAKSSFTTSNNSAYRPSAADHNYVNTTIAGCGDSKIISSTNIEAAEIEGQVNCYQTALIGIDKRMPSTAKLSIDLCSNFKYYSQKVDCFKKIGQHQEALDIEAAVKQHHGLTPKEKILTVTKLNSYVAECLDNPKMVKKTNENKEKYYSKIFRKDGSAVQTGFKNPEVFYKKGYNCIVEKFERAAQNKSESSTPVPTSSGAQ